MVEDIMDMMAKGAKIENDLKNRFEGPFAPQDPKKLNKAFYIFIVKNFFAAGDIVEWKPGMRNRRSAGPFIVIRQYEDGNIPVNEEKSGMPGFMEPLDLAVGVIDETDNEFMIFHVDSRRMQHHHI